MIMWTRKHWRVLKKNAGEHLSKSSRGARSTLSLGITLDAMPEPALLTGSVHNLQDCH